MSTSNLVDTEPGGENTQYESINTVTKPHSKKQSQLPDGEQQTGASEQQARDHSDRGQTTAENARYGEAFSEHGFGGETTTNSAQSGREGGYGGTGSEEAQLGQSRREQGYGGGSGVGA